MSRQHQRNRRRAYGRRQHEVRERRPLERLEPDLEEGTLAASTVATPEDDLGFGFLASPRARLRWAEGAA